MNRFLCNLMFVLFLFQGTYAQLFSEFRAEDFVFVNGSSDTIYLAEDKDVGEGSYLIFYTKPELYAYLNELNKEKTGEILNEYLVSIEESEDRYISKNEVSAADYNAFCESTGKPFPEQPIVYLDEREKEEYCHYLSGLWGIPVRLSENREREFYESFRLMIAKKDWDKKEFLDKLNGFMQEGYGVEVPVFFTIDGITEPAGKSIAWNDFEKMSVDRGNGVAAITSSSDEIKFRFTDSQYTHIASMHVNFLAFYKIMQE